MDSPYESPESIAGKKIKFVAKMNFAGVIVWENYLKDPSEICWIANLDKNRLELLSLLN